MYKKVSSIMKQDVITIRDNETLFDASIRMNEHNIGALVVKGNQGNIVGIISERDIARALAVYGDRTALKPVSDVMTPNPVTIHDYQIVFDANEKMADNSIRHLPVLNSDGRLVGIVSSTDLLREHSQHFESLSQFYEDYISR